ncbi:DUF4082 domain-containing protein [Microbispora sp. H10836]|uniref:DUF4082 domain-containing protein n=1 Tax=Microbispora sp. H10836 TaxID=2729106 RepID=UPI001474BFEA|nr:DUF4082 domain-containing protein [Microbispora sp. H10836]
MNRTAGTDRRGREPAAAGTHPRRRDRSRHTRRHRLAAALAAALAAGGLLVVPGKADAATPNLGNSATYAVLASVSVTNTDLTQVTGNLGVSPGNSVSGFPPGTVNGTIHAGDSAAASAMSDAVAARDAITGMSRTALIGPNLGGTTLGPGVYDSTTGAYSLDGTLTLDAQTNPDAIFVLRASSLSAARVSNIALVNGAQEDNVYWQFTGTASLGMWATFRGNVLANGNVSVGPGANVFGRMFSLGGTVAIQGTSQIPATLIMLPNNPPTTTTLTASPNPAHTGKVVTFTANVQAQSGSVVPAGEVAFKDNGVLLGKARQSNGQPAVFTTSRLAARQHQITAVYLGGDTFDNEALIHFAPSTSQPVVQTVTTTALWSDSATPAVASQNDSNPVVLGVKFRSSQDGMITGIRFYKGPQNTGTHTGSLWTADGQRLATVIFTGETASGWQAMSFPDPVAISAGTTYVASYHTTSGYYSVDRDYFNSQYVNSPLVGLASAASGGNGVYTYSATDTFPTSSYRASNYWVDVMFNPASTLWPDTTTPGGVTQSDSQAVSLGVKFRTTQDGVITGIRFYKGPQNTGTHTGSLWTATGGPLASATFTGETASGWQTVLFPTPVAVSAGTTYVASYHTTSGYYSADRNYFNSQYVNNPLIGLADAASGGNGVYTYSATDIFPSNTYHASNYWVEPILE